MNINETLERLNQELPFPVKKSKLHFYNKIKLVSADREDKKYNAKLDYDEKDYVELRLAILLSYIGVSLEHIDLLINKKRPTIDLKILDELELREKVIKWVRKILK
jgi:DNA-binding transcriptional MerR regulator